MPPPPPEIFASSVGRGLPDAPLLEVLAGDFAAPAEICCFGGEISPPEGGEFLSQLWERNQRIAGGCRPPVPHYGGRVPARLCKISGAQNLSGDLRFLPGHWALASPKFQSVRFLFRAWLYRANAPSAHTAVGATLAVALSLPLWGRCRAKRGG